MNSICWNNSLSITSLIAFPYNTKLCIFSSSKFSLFCINSYQMMVDCWSDNPESRPSFEILVERTRKMIDEPHDKVRFTLINAFTVKMKVNI